MATVDLTDVEVGAGFVLTPGQSATYLLNGTYTGNAILEKRGADGGFDIVATSPDDASMSGTITNPIANNEKRAYFQFRGEVDSGTAVGAITAADSDVVLPGKTIVGPDGTVLLVYRDDGVLIPKMANDGVTDGVGVVLADALIAVEETGVAPYHKTVITLIAKKITLTDDSGNGQWGTLPIYAFPAGNIKILGVVIDAVLTLDDALWTDAAAGDVAIGSVAISAHGALGTTAGDMLSATAIAAMTAQVGPIDAQSLADEPPLASAGGTDDIANLNVAIDDAAAHVTDTDSTITGTITITWMNLGDL